MQNGIGGWLMQTNGASGIVVWSIALILALVVLFLAVVGLKRWLRGGGEEESPPGAGFTLGELREMHREGQLSDEEYERARGQLVQAHREASKAPASRGGQTELK